MSALQQALQTVFGIEGSLEGIAFAGRTDPMIIRDIFGRFSIEPTPANTERYVAGYLSVLPSVLAAGRSRVLPGVVALLEQAAARTDIAQALLTGNIRSGAQTKLGHHGLWGYFPVGAFADDSEDRNELGPHALRRARIHWGAAFPEEEVWVVGDTPHDVACARALGARVLAVATGSFAAADLAVHRPDAVLEDLGSAAAFWRALGA